MKQTTIAIDVDVWKKLNQLKDVGDSFSDVVRRLVADVELNPRPIGVDQWPPIKDLPHKDMEDFFNEEGEK